MPAPIHYIARRPDLEILERTRRLLVDSQRLLRETVPDTFLGTPRPGLALPPDDPAKSD